MKTRHARQIRAGVNAAKLAERFPRLAKITPVNLGRLGQRAFREYKKRAYGRAHRKLTRRIEETQKRIDEAKARVAETKAQVAEEHRIAREFAGIINHSWGKR